MSHSDGDTHVNLCLAVIAQAANDSRTRCGTSELWTDFRKDYDLTRKNQDPVEIATWLGSWWAVNKGVKSRRLG